MEVGAVLRIAAPRDLVNETAQAIEHVLASLALPAAGMLLFNCGGRLLEAHAADSHKALWKAMSPIPVGGFSTYGEHFGPINVNHTLTGIAFASSEL